MKLSSKRFHIRTVILYGSLATLFFISMTVYLINDYNTPINNLIKESAIIDTAYHNTYIKERLSKPDLTKECLDIELTDKPYIIRLTNYKGKIWNNITSGHKKYEEITYWFPKRQPNGNILHNPRRLDISSITHISFSRTKRLQLIALCFMILFSTIFLILVISAINTYKIEFRNEDRILIKENKLKLLGKWLFFGD